MTQNSTPQLSQQQLLQRLEERLQQDRRAIETLTKRQLSELESGLNHLSNAALATTKDATQAAHNALTQHQQTVASMLTQQQNLLGQQIRQHNQSLIWLMKTPLLITLTACLAAVLLTWVWLPAELFSATTTVRVSPSGKYLIITSPDWTTCQMQSNGPAQPCRRIQ